MLNKKTEKSIIYDYLICLSSLVIISIYYYGWRGLIVTSISAITCYTCDMICIYLRKQQFAFSDISAIVTGIIFAMLLPASMPYNILIISCIIMVVIGKQAFGGIENPVFNTVAVGYAFASLCWKETMFLFPKPTSMGQLDLSSNVSNELVNSFTYNIDHAPMPTLSNFDMILGRFIGPMGTTHIIIIMVCAIALIARKSISFLTFFSCLGTLLTTAFFFPPAIRETRISSVLYELVGGATLFVLVFIACDIKYAPKTKYARIVYGIIIGLLTILFRRYSGVEVGIIFAVLIANVLSEPLDNNYTHIKMLIKKIIKSIKKCFYNLYKLLFYVTVLIIKLIYFAFKFSYIFMKKMIKSLINKLFRKHNDNVENNENELDDNTNDLESKDDICVESSVKKEDKKSDNKEKRRLFSKKHNSNQTENYHKDKSKKKNKRKNKRKKIKAQRRRK